MSIDYVSKSISQSSSITCVLLSHFIIKSIGAVDLVHGLRSLEFDLMTLEVSKGTAYSSQKLMNPMLYLKNFNLLSSDNR